MGEQMIDFFSVNVLSIIFFCAIIPFLLLVINYYAHKFFKKDTVEQENNKLLRFDLSQRVITARLFGLLFILGLFLFVICRKVVFEMGSWSPVVFFAYLTYNLYLDFLLSRYEKRRKLIYDYACNIYEYYDGKAIIVFSHSDILEIVVHQYLFKVKTTKIADLYLEDKVIRISNALVDFNRIPLLESKAVTYKNYFFKPMLPGYKKRANT